MVHLPPLIKKPAKILIKGGKWLFHSCNYLITRRAASLAQILPALGKMSSASVKVRVRSNDFQLGVNSEVELFRYQTYATKEPETLDWIDHYIGKNDVLYDIGANIGLYSLYAAKARGCSVLAFEPEAQNFSRLSYNIYRNELRGRVIPYCLALSDTSGADILHVTTIDAGSSQHNLGAPNIEYMGEGFVAPILQGSLGLRVDQLWQEYGLPKPNHIKIDVDGLEERIVRGAMETIRSPNLKSVLVELNTESGKINPIVDLLTSWGLKIQGVYRRPSSTSTLDISNYIFIKA